LRRSVEVDMLSVLRFPSVSNVSHKAILQHVFTSGKTVCKSA
jgi:hypothetical protein